MAVVGQIEDSRASQTLASSRDEVPEAVAVSDVGGAARDLAAKRLRPGVARSATNAGGGSLGKLQFTTGVANIPYSYDISTIPSALLPPVAAFITFVAQPEHRIIVAIRNAANRATSSPALSISLSGTEVPGRCETDACL